MRSRTPACRGAHHARADLEDDGSLSASGADLEGESHGSRTTCAGYVLPCSA
ncbi:hypothetical protein [Rubrivirga sp.]|uniref:hypothetical protein n=1 Tax=Rubrivirga sp. TaxID=1885344 RepID=UPI003C7787B7